MAQQHRQRLEDSKNGTRLTRLFQAVSLVIASRLMSPDAKNNLVQIREDSTQELNGLLEQSTLYAQTEIPNRYAQGLTEATAILQAAKVAMSAPNKEAHDTVVQSMAGELVDDFAKGILAVQDGIESAVSQAQRQKIMARFGSGLRKEQEEAITQILQEQGTKGLLDRGGKRWNITTYAKMLVKTKEREALNVGMITRAQEVGISVFRINDTGSTHKECAAWENRLVSLAGEFGLPTVSDATSGGVFHPNCRHRLFPDPTAQRKLENQE